MTRRAQHDRESTMHQPMAGDHRPANRPLHRRLLGLALALGTLGAGLIVPATTLAATTPTTLTDGTGSTCTGHWPASVQGMPTFHAGSRAGDRICDDSTG